MKKLIVTLLMLIFYLPLSSFARSDYNDSLLNWDLFYYRFRISGYPSYNTLFDRYDFYDLDENYCGSLNYNPLLGEWEYFGL